MRRWGQIAEAKPDDWYDEMARKIYLPDVYLKAARLLVEEGKAQEAEFPWATDGYREQTADFIDGIAYDGRTPNAYLEKFAIGLRGDQTVDGTSVAGR